MRPIDNKLYLTIKELVECGIPETTLWTAKSKGTKCWSFIDDPEDKRKVLVEYEALRDIYKKMVLDRFGNPYDMVARQPILDMVQQDPKAFEFYNTYRYAGSKYLPVAKVNQYTRAASWLRMLTDVKADRQIITKILGLSNIPAFYEHAAHLIQIEKRNGESDTYTGLLALPGTFPTSYKRINENCNDFATLGYEMLIHHAYGNKSAAKLGKTADGYDEELEKKQMAVIRRVAAHGNNLDAGQVNKLVSPIFEKNGWATVSDRRIKQLMTKNGLILMPGRKGKRAFLNNAGMQNKRTAPVQALQYWTLDGWTVELLYQEGGKYHHRLDVVIVLDACGKYPVGYAIGDRESPALIKAALRNAVLHMQEMFGGSYCPVQIQSDNYQVKNLTPFYQAMSQLYIPTAVGNAKAKIIEPYFKYLNHEYCQLLINWGGHNVDASKEKQVNREAQKMQWKTFPDRKGVELQIHQIMAKERSLKFEDFKAALPESRNELPPLSREWLTVFGQQVGGTNQISGQGIIKQIDNVQYTYDSFDPLFRKNLNLKWKIFADKDDLSAVLAVSPDDTLRFVLHKKMELAMDVESMTPEQQAYRAKVAGYNKALEEEIIQTYIEDTEITEQVLLNTPGLDKDNEAILKLHPIYNGQQKHQLQSAKQLGNPKQPSEPQLPQETAPSYLAQKIDINQFLNNE